MLYFFHVGYNGFNYRGWQRLPQTNGQNVQQVIEEALSRILKTDVAIVGCGRTDAQVHASQFFFHVDLDEPWEFDLAFRLNKVLPSDIAVFDILPVEPRRHARFDAFSRTYNYFVHMHKDPFLDAVSSGYPQTSLDLLRMKKAVRLLTRYSDYRAFCKNTPADKDTVCTMTTSDLYVNANGRSLRFEFTANRFLSGMIRILVSKLLEVGAARLQVDEFENQLSSAKKPSINRLAHPQGLHLSKVRYRYLDIPNRSEWFNAMAAAERWEKV